MICAATLSTTLTPYLMYWVEDLQSNDELEVVISTAPWLGWAAFLAGTAWIWRDPLAAARALAQSAGGDPQQWLACPQCSYSLSGLREIRCPECGWQATTDGLLNHAIERMGVIP
jgi:hypothetical protein